VQLASGLDAGKSVTVEVDAMYPHALTPYPSQITQAEKQYVIFEGNLYLYSPYKVVSQKTTVVTPTSALESYTKTKPVSFSENIISYGPYEDKAPFSEVCVSN
jgi:oligosaccharyltransferase complex subunit alpha (ribophorin I)